jgi:mono/diheme cytochrome c family protein
MGKGLRWAAGLLLAGISFTSLAQLPGSVERGRYLAEGVLACGNCHVQRGPQGQPLMDKGLSGGMPFIEAGFQAHASNITPDPETGIGRWTDAQLARAIREGIRPDNTVIGPPMPISFYRNISDADRRDVVAYLRAQAPVKNTVAKSTYSFPLPPAYGPPIASVASTSRTDKLAYGKYLADVGHCMDCHTPRNAEGQLVQAAWGSGGQIFKGPWGESLSRNLTAHETGLKGWTDKEVESAIRTGKDRAGQPYKPPMAFDYYRNVSAEDMSALVGYLRTLPAQAIGGTRN